MHIIPNKRHISITVHLLAFLIVVILYNEEIEKEVEYESSIRH